MDYYLWYSKRSDAEIIENIKNAEDLANNNVFPTTKQLKYMALGIAVLNRKIDGATLTSKEENLLQIIHQKAVDIWQNDQNMRDKITQLNNQQEPDLDDGWNDVDDEGDLVE